MNTDTGNASSSRKRPQSLQAADPLKNLVQPSQWTRSSIWIQIHELFSSSRNSGRETGTRSQSERFRNPGRWSPPDKAHIPKLRMQAPRSVVSIMVLL
jgi:hypothetical protein